jgi:hypothetical protein
MRGIFGASYSYGSSNSMTASGGHAGVFIIALILVAVVAVVSIVAMWKIFVKAGRPGWAAIIPFYNNWVLFEISGKPGWWMLSVLLSVIPFVGWILYFVLYILAMLELAKRFNKSTAFAVFGMIIFSVIGFLILGYGKDEYHGAPSGTAGPGVPTPPQAPNPPVPTAPAPPSVGTPPVM